MSQTILLLRSFLRLGNIVDRLHRVIDRLRCGECLAVEHGALLRFDQLRGFGPMQLLGDRVVQTDRSRLGRRERSRVNERIRIVIDIRRTDERRRFRRSCARVTRACRVHDVALVGFHFHRTDGDGLVGLTLENDDAVEQMQLLVLLLVVLFPRMDVAQGEIVQQHLLVEENIDLVV